MGKGGRNQTGDAAAFPPCRLTNGSYAVQVTNESLAPGTGRPVAAEEVPDIMRQNLKFASIALTLTFCFGGAPLVLAAPQSDSWQRQQRQEQREWDRRPERESRQRNEVDVQRRQPERQAPRSPQQAERRENQQQQRAARPPQISQPEIRQPEDRRQADMRSRQREQRVERERFGREQAKQRERQSQQQATRDLGPRWQSAQQDRTRNREADDRRRQQQATAERERHARDARQQTYRQVQQQTLLRQQPQNFQHRDKRDNESKGRYAGRQENDRSAEYRRPYRPVYNDRPWYGYHGRGKQPHHRGPVVIYRNVTHVVTIPRPVYVQPVAGYYYDDYYYSGPYAGYDSVYGYDDYGYGYRRSACNSDTVGAVIGAVLGGVIGAHQDRGGGPVVGGALIGAVLGGLLGHAIDESNQACVGDILEYVPANRPVYWEDRGYGYEVTPLRTYEPEPGRYCREYQTVVTVGGRAEQAYSTACRQPDGSWQIVS